LRAQHAGSGSRDPGHRLRPHRGPRPVGVDEPDRARQHRHRRAGGDAGAAPSSEPSNAWPAGVASLFTLDFYRSAARALEPGGFAQWGQLYGLTTPALRMVLTTIAAAFPELQVWWLDVGNLLVLASAEPPPISPARVRAVLGGALAADLRRHAHMGEPDEIWG